MEPLIFLLLLLSLAGVTLSDPRTTQAGIFCGGSKPSDPATFIRNFVSDMEVLSDLVSSQRFGAYTAGASPDSGQPPSPSAVYGLAQCMLDLSYTDCLLCFAQCRTKLPSCLPSNSGRIFLDGCFLRYDNRSFYTESVGPLDTAVCGRLTEPLKETEGDYAFSDAVMGLIENVSLHALRDEGFGVGYFPADGAGFPANKSGGGGGGDSKVVYALAQCWVTVSKKGCWECLAKAKREVRGCLPAREGRALNAGCYLRYSDESFFRDYLVGVGGDEDGYHVKESHGGFGNRGLVSILAFATSISLVVLLSVLCVCLCYRRLSQRRKDRKHLGRLTTGFSKSGLNFKYETLEKATDFFNSSRKLGQGGAGSVYKGVLSDGRIVAVKRLFFNTRQWVDEFFNEVNLIHGIEHKNLVKLLGCSIEGPESLLVYEYVPNKSLDHFVFNKNRTEVLSWQKRFEIILGTAEGLTYLHEGSKSRIIHRDIKSSNVLLDENLTAKIADFGLARHFSDDKTHLSTGIAGTLGYMAPEYLVRGQLTEKVDVYSFGVLVLEIVCGRKNSIYSQESGSVLENVWKNFKANTLPESVDKALKGNFPAKEASNALQIGLLCTQASAALRPSMSGVVSMLTDKDCPIPSPMQPPFLNASVVDPDTCSKSSSLPSLVSPVTDSPHSISISGPR